MNNIYLTSGTAINLTPTTTSSQDSISVNVDCDSLCTQSSSAILIGYGTSDPTSSTPGLIYIKVESEGDVD